MEHIFERIHFNIYTKAGCVIKFFQMLRTLRKTGKNVHQKEDGGGMQLKISNRTLSCET